MKVSGFDWDDGNRSKCEQHGVSAGDIEAVFVGGPRVAPDIAHSDQELRSIAVGLNKEGRAIFVAFTFREKNAQMLIRPISARFMHKKESNAYAQDGPEAQDG